MAGMEVMDEGTVQGEFPDYPVSFFGYLSHLTLFVMKVQQVSDSIGGDVTWLVDTARVSGTTQQRQGEFGVCKWHDDHGVEGAIPCQLDCSQEKDCNGGWRSVNQGGHFEEGWMGFVPGLGFSARSCDNGECVLGKMEPWFLFLDRETVVVNIPTFKLKPHDYQ